MSEPGVEAINEGKLGVGYVAALDGAWAVGGSSGAPLVIVSGSNGFTPRQAPESNGLRDVLALGEERALVVGEDGGLFETKNGGAKWRSIPTKTKGCLFAITTAPNGAIWVGGDDAFLFRSNDDGKTWKRPRIPKKISSLERISCIVPRGDALYLVGHSGKLGVLRGASLEVVDLDGPLTALAFSPDGVGLVVGDEGQAFRSTDGKKWAPVATDTESDLEAVAWVRDRFVVVGASGTLITSTDGEAFLNVPTGLDEHLWAALDDGNRLLVGGDGGLVVHVTDAALARASKAEPVQEDEEVEEEAEAVTLARTPIGDAELEKASRRWIEEGRRYYAALNAFVAGFYSGEKEPSVKEEPEETRKDMAPWVQRVAVQLNREGRQADLRRLFPPSYEAFDYEDIGQSVDSAFYLPDDTILMRAGGRVYRVSGDSIEERTGVRAIGRSYDRSFIALATPDGIEVRRGVDGPVHAKLANPASLDIESMEVFPDGKRLLLASAQGIFIVDPNGVEWIHPEPARRKDTDMSYAHAALSPDGRTLACGDQDSVHRLLVEEKGSFLLAAQIVPRSSYPCFALFHDKRPHVALSACHFGGSSTLGLDLSHLRVKPGEKRKVFSASGFDGDDTLDYIDERNWVYSGVPREAGYLLGDRNGYAWLEGFDGQLQAYLHIGSTMESMDASPDDRRLLFGTYAGYLVEIDRTADDPHPYKVKSFPKGKETRRWVFWRGFPPMSW